MVLCFKRFNKCRPWYFFSASRISFQGHLALTRCVVNGASLATIHYRTCHLPCDLESQLAELRAGGLLINGSSSTCSVTCIILYIQCYLSRCCSHTWADIESLCSKRRASSGFGTACFCSKPWHSFCCLPTAFLRTNLQSPQV